MLAAVQRPISPACITVAVARPLWKDRPTWFLVAEQDRMIVADNQRFMAERMQAQVRSHAVDHTPLVTAPGVVLDVLREAIAAVRAERDTFTIRNCQPSAVSKQVTTQRSEEIRHDRHHVSHRRRRRLQGLLSRGRRAGRAEAAAAARLPERRPHVPRSHPAAGRSLPYRRPGSAGLRQFRHAGARVPYASTGSPTIIDRFTEIVGFDRYAVYVFDYGAPTGFRLAVKHPDRITAIISQNGNAYEEGLSDGWNPIRAYWEDPSQANRDALRAFLKPETTIWQYTHGVPDPTKVSPDGYSLDNFYLARPGADELQLDLFGDYKSNVALYPTFQNYFRTHKPPFLAVWGKNDPFFLPPGAEAFKRDIPNAVVRFFDTGHFALETHAAEIAAAIRDQI